MLKDVTDGDEVFIGKMRAAATVTGPIKANSWGASLLHCNTYWEYLTRDRTLLSVFMMDAVCTKENVSMSSVNQSRKVLQLSDLICFIYFK